ncbi:hypothetical protein [Brachybacterium sacelli]|uniref:hypothetical protein n=1 Tax=Brachybacterium sacelli TaxID=173364 RepID=UPI003606FE85
MLDIQNVRAGCTSAGANGFFCDYVTRSLLNDPEFAPTYEERRKLLYGGGLTIKTTLDPAKQKTANEVLQRRVPGDSESGFGHSIVTVEPGSGNILTMAQNREFNPHAEVEPGETAINYNVPRPSAGSSGFPVGSTFKPFVLQQWLKSGHCIYDKVSTGRETMKTFPAQCLPRGRWYEEPGYNRTTRGLRAISPMETVLNGTKFSINTAYAKHGPRSTCARSPRAPRDIGVGVPATHNPFDPATWNNDISSVYGSELAHAVVVLGEVRISALDMANSYATWAAAALLQAAGHRRGRRPQRRRDGDLRCRVPPGGRQGGRRRDHLDAPAGSRGPTRPPARAR